MTATLTRTAINSSANDHVTNEGVRISCPLYIDLTTIQRKALLNAARELAESTTTTTPTTQSGISVATTNGGLTKLEHYLGCSFDILRGSLFQRGGVPIDLVLRLQLATGVEVVSLKEIEAGIKNKIAVVKSFVEDNQYV
jgi:hypothetical protein